jgi:RNA polymerase sigma factor (sigma-70 family)
MSDGTVTGLLERLSSAGRDAAWGEFLARYSSLIMRVVRRHENDENRSKDCFDFVCGALSDQAFRRLLGFRPDGPARFETWLMAVASNLCVDWHRKVRGRARPPRCVSRLPELDQQVYRCIFQQGMSRAQCVETLAPVFPGLSVSLVAGINARLFALLTPQQRWWLSARPDEPERIDECATPLDDDAVLQVPGSGPGPDELAARSQERSQLRDALSRLPVEQRLLLRLRYEQNLTLAEIARLTGQPDPFRANRQIQAALDALAADLGARHCGSDRKSP